LHILASHYTVETVFRPLRPFPGAGDVSLLSEGMERAEEEQKSQCLQGFPRFFRLARQAQDTPGLLLRLFCPFGRDKKRRQAHRGFDAETEVRRWRGVTMVYINRENLEFKDSNRNF